MPFCSHYIIGLILWLIFLTRKEQCTQSYLHVMSNTKKNRNCLSERYAPKKLQSNYKDLTQICMFIYSITGRNVWYNINETENQQLQKRNRNQTKVSAHKMDIDWKSSLAQLLSWPFFSWHHLSILGKGQVCVAGIEI